MEMEVYNTTYIPEERTLLKYRCEHLGSACTFLETYLVKDEFPE
jgi:hypothetical protein